MESFYGGRKGISFVISKKFDGIDIPENTIRTGDYYATNANGVFLIEEGAPIVRSPKNQDNPDYIWKHHLHDGAEVQEGSDVYFKEEWAVGMVQFFAKGTETASEVGYGEYVIIDTISGLHNYNAMENGIVYRRGMNYQEVIEDSFVKPGAGAEYIGQVIGPQGETPIVNMDSIANIKQDSNFSPANSNVYNIQNAGIVSGKEHDVIEYAWVEMKDIFGNNIGVKLGFTFPYTVFDFSAEHISAYVQPTVERVGNVNKPYYYQIKLGIPKGIHGTDSTDIEIYNTYANKGAKIYKNKELTQAASPSTLSSKTRLGTTSANWPSSIGANWSEETENWAALTMNGKTCYVNKKDTSETRMRYRETDYNQSTPVITYYDIGEYKTISGVTLSHEGILTVAYTHGQPTPLQETIRWIEQSDDINGIELADDGTITVTYNTGEKLVHNDALTWITSASISDKGAFKILYNNKNIPTYNKTLRWINKCTIDKDGTIKFFYCTGEEAYKQEKFLKVIDNIQVDTGAVEGAGTQKVTVTYNTGEKVAVGKGLNYIIESVVTEAETAAEHGAKPFHLLVLYADPTKRGNVSYPSEVFNTVRADWKDLGYIRGEVGTLRAIGNFDTIDNLKRADGTWLTPPEVEGYNNERVGWGYTINEKHFYIYDYNKKIWYNVGNINIEVEDFIVIDAVGSNSDVPMHGEHLYENGLWLIVEQSDCAI